MNNKRLTGDLYESRAVAYLNEQGIEVIDRNVYTKRGEIDIIAKEQGYLCFIEVKYRSSTKCGMPADAVTNHKRRNIYEAARVYLYKNHISYDTPCRFDVIAILGTQINYIRNAYGGL